MCFCRVGIGFCRACFGFVVGGIDDGLRDGRGPV
jgi:hypothetical protein